MRLLVYIEIAGQQTYAGDIAKTDKGEYGFRYSDSYMASGASPISVSLPFEGKRYSAEKTRNFFEGLLPEGFVRRAVAGRLHVAEDDYIALLQALGNECLGAIRVIGEETAVCEEGYDLLSLDQVRALAAEGTTRSVELVTQSHLSLTGASGKVGLYWDAANDAWYLPRGIAASTHIVKQSHIRYKNIVTNEQLCMRTAAKLGIDTPESFIINTGSASDDEVLFATERFDREIEKNAPVVSGLPRPCRLHQEDFALALGIASADKYERPGDLYLKRAFRLLADNVTNPIRDQLRLWDIIVYDYLVGNTDNHLKNISLVYDRYMKKISLAPAYDMVSTVVYDGDFSKMSVAIAGELDINKLTEKHFAECASEIGLGTKMAMERFENMRIRFETGLKESAYELKELGFDTAPQIADKILFTRDI